MKEPEEHDAATTPDEGSKNPILRAYHFFEGNFGQGTIAGVVFLVGFLIWIAFFDPLSR